MKALALLLGLALAGCGTVIPTTVQSSAASFDGNDQNSGIISANANGYVVTSHFRDRYNALASIYGRDFSVPLVPDAGLMQIDAWHWLIDRQHLSQFLEMQSWQRAGISPKNDHANACANHRGQLKHLADLRAARNCLRLADVEN